MGTSCRTLHAGLGDLKSSSAIFPDPIAQGSYADAENLACLRSIALDLLQCVENDLTFDFRERFAFKRGDVAHVTRCAWL